MLILEHARGGWMNVYYGNLELIDENNAKWWAKVQRGFFELQSFGHTYPFGGLPGQEEPYGFCSVGADGSLYTAINPSQSIRTLRLPRVHRLQAPPRAGRIQFRDAGFVPKLADDRLTLGPEQMAVVGFGECEKAKYDLGIQEDVIIPHSIRPLAAQFQEAGTNAVTGSVAIPAQGDVRIVMRQCAGDRPIRTSGGAPPNGATLARLLEISVSQEGRPVPLKVNYDKAIWSGLSWAVGEIKRRDLKAGVPLEIRCTSREKQSVQLRVELFVVSYF
jgi:hypothetical protein